MELQVELKPVKTLIVSGDGINADQELLLAFQNAGSICQKVHVNQLVENPTMIHQFDIMAFPGGFSFGDEIRSGKVFAIKMKNQLLSELKKFKEDKKLVIGICNGFQILVQLNLFSQELEAQKEFTLTTNDHGKFKNFWTKVKVLNTKTPWLNDISEDFYLPVRHKEGRIFGKIDPKLYALKYESSINGSIDDIAGIVDESGLVFGLMPHPEAATSSLLNPEGVPLTNATLVQKIFKNAINYSQRI